MAYRYGIPRVRDHRGQVWGREAINPNPPFTPPLTCGGCTVAVHPVAAFSRRTKRGPTAVKAHYRLPPGTKHDEQCPYDFERRARGIRRDSHGTVEERNGRWRLLLPNATETRAMDSPVVRAGATRPRQSLQVQHSRRRLTAALNSARRITRLLHEFDDAPEEVDQFRAVYGRRAIRWSDFVYGPDDYDRLLTRLSAGTPAHPIAVHGSIHTITTGKNGSTYLLRARGRARSADQWVPIVIRTKDRTILPTSDNAQWLAYGDWKQWSGTNNYNEIQLWVHGPWQLTTWPSNTPEDKGPGE